VICGLILVRQAIENGLKIPRKCLYRLVTVSFLLVQKFSKEEHHSLESYSLLSGIPIKEIINLEAALLEILDFRVVPDEREVENFKRRELEGINLVQRCTVDQ